MQRWEQQGYTPKKKLTLKTVSSVLDEPSNYGSQSFAHPSAASDVPVQFLNENYKSLPQELKKWSTADVVRWLDQQGLAKQFAVIFNENQVTGTTLVEGNLHFLDTLKEISLEDRELLLSSIYELLNPNSIQVKEDDLKRFTSNAEREKYLAAVHVAQSKDTHLHLVEATSPNAPSAMSTSSSCSSPFNRHLEWPNHDNDTSCMHQSHISLDEREVTTESCSMSSFANDWGSSEVSRCVARQVSLYELLSLEKRKEVCCIDVNRPENSHFEFNVETTEQGHVLINEARGLEINPGDRILEVNGVYICNENDLKQATKNCDWLRMVVVRSEIPSEAEVYEPQSASFLHESKNLKNQTSELKSRNELDVNTGPNNHQGGFFHGPSPLLKYSPTEVTVSGVGTATRTTTSTSSPSHNQTSPAAAPGITDQQQDPKTPSPCSPAVLSSSEWRWKKLRDLVLQMKEKDIDVLLNDGVNQKTEEAKDKYILQEEIRQLQEALNSSSKKINHLQKALESKTTALQELGSEHEQLRKKIENQSHKSTESDDSLSQEGYADQECWRNLSDSKEDLLEELKEKTAEASQQKAFLDNLLSAVVKHAPWLLDDVDADLESMAMMSHGEQWC
ncbi:uncharacterized protein LOC115216697 isoform X2 [Octopus sinensis]|uniref:Uncharacterized protein LOC115216697 isoform X2 n=1 Tax=Octopus sinensis TaxID=2607531 RepID=A0A6P7SV09_9MOLL|nr:uncharacterized protein LOC115216697 isoform X2 [Octopus sinensis]